MGYTLSDITIQQLVENRVRSDITMQQLVENGVSSIWHYNVAISWKWGTLYLTLQCSN